jgi:membrane-bound lytic murein transglycosylase D
MDSTTSKKALLCVLLSLAAAGCATTATEVAPATAAESSVVSTFSTTPRAATPAHPTAAITVAEQPAPAIDVWARLRTGYGLAPLDSHLIGRHEQWFANNPEYMQRMMERARLYLFFIAEEVEKRKMPMEIALLPAIESAYKPYAYSRAKAAGLWQFIAPTGRLYGLNMNWWTDERRDVMASTRAALDYLEKLNKDFNGDWHLALAAYNAGEGKIGRMMEYNRRLNKPTEYQHLKLKAETVNYVPKLIAMANIVANPEKYGVTLLPIRNEPYFTRVDTGSQIDLGVVSRLTNVSVDDLQYINPHLNRWATHPEGPHYLLVPVDKKDTLLEGLNNLPAHERVQWRGHEVRRGETLAQIAQRHGVSVEAIRSSNNLSSNVLRVGHNLIIPVSSRPMVPAAVVSAKPAVPVAVPKTAWNTSGNVPVIHRVRAGETLWSIARRYGVLVAQIVEWNLLEHGDVLKLGQRLRIFPIGPAPAAALRDDTPNS